MTLMTPMLDKAFSPDKQSAFEARFEAQKIAFGPVVFQCVRYAWKRGILEALAAARETGVSVDALAGTGRWTPYALKLVLETCLSCGVVRLSGGRYVLDKAGYCVLSDRITQINLNFVHDVCYQGLFDLDKSLDAQRPIGLKALGDWATIYEGLAMLPEPARSSWFAFDHHYSDTSFPSILPDVFATAPKRILDIGANTGKFSRAALEHAVLHTTPERLSHAAVSTQHVTARDNIPPPSDAARLAGDVDAIISRAMRIDPADRYPSMEALVADLRRWMERRPIAARREDRSYRTRLWLRRNWLPVSLTTTLFVALGAGLALSVWQYERARAEASRANKTADYLVELLGRADPDLHGGKWPSALDLLDEAARDSKLRFRDEPVTEERLARLFAGIYRSLSRDSDALPLARRALALSTDLYGEQSLNTLRARSLLAWTLYWSDDYTEAVNLMQPVMESAPKLLPAKSPELLETRLRYANILAGVYRIDESEALFRDVIGELQNTNAALPNRAWRIADAEGDLAAAYTRAGRWQDALNLLRKNAQQYANPPANDLKTALNHQGNLITVQNVLGDPRGVEPTILDLIGRWQRLAGERSERIDELLNDLGLYYVQAGLGADALRTFERLLDRAKAHGDSDTSNQLRNQLDLIEVRARFNLSPAAELLAGLDRLTDQVVKQVSPDSPRLRQLLLRSAMVAVALEQADKAEKLVASAREKGRDKSPANATRIETALASIARTRGQHDAAIGQIERRLQDYEKKGEQVSLRHAFVLIDHAYVLTLRGHPADRARALESLTQAKTAIPEAVSPTHRVFAQWNYVNTGVQHGFDSPEALRHRDDLAAHFGRGAAAMPAVLSGFFVQP